MDFLTNNPDIVEQIVMLVGTVVGALWTYAKSTELWRNHKDDKYMKAMDFIEAAAEDTYRNFVREIKNSREDGKLTADEVKSAIKQTTNKAKTLATTQGVDLARELGEEYLNLAISRAVQSLKTS